MHQDDTLSCNDSLSARSSWAVPRPALCSGLQVMVLAPLNEFAKAGVHVQRAGITGGDEADATGSDEGCLVNLIFGADLLSSVSWSSLPRRSLRCAGRSSSHSC